MRNRITFRSTEKAEKMLKVMAKLYGAKTPSDLLRDMVEAMCSGDVHSPKVAEFQRKMLEAQIKLNQIRAEKEAEKRQLSLLPQDTDKKPKKK